MSLKLKYLKNIKIDWFSIFFHRRIEKHLDPKQKNIAWPIGVSKSILNWWYSKSRSFGDPISKRRFQMWRVFKRAKKLYFLSSFSCRTRPKTHWSANKTACDRLRSHGHVYRKFRWFFKGSMYQHKSHNFLKKSSSKKLIRNLSQKFFSERNWKYIYHQVDSPCFVHETKSWVSDRASRIENRELLCIFAKR